MVRIGQTGGAVGFAAAPIRDSLHLEEVSAMRLIVVRGPKAVEPLVLGDVVAVVGRDEAADLVLPSRRVSRRHCEVRVEGGGVRFTDLGSQNMLIDPSGRKLHDAVFVPGERVQVGDYLIEVDAGSEPRERTETLELDPEDVPDDLVLEDDFLETDETSSKGLVETVHVSPTSSAIFPTRSGPLKVSQRKGGGARLVDPPADLEGPTPKAARPPPFVPPTPPGSLKPLVPQSPAVHDAARVASLPSRGGVAAPTPVKAGPPPAAVAPAPAPVPVVAARVDAPVVREPNTIPRAVVPVAAASADPLARGVEKPRVQPRPSEPDSLTPASPAPRLVRHTPIALPLAGPAPRGPGVPLVIQALFVVFLAAGLMLFAPFGGQLALVRASADGWEAAALARGEMAANTLAIRNGPALAVHDQARLDSCCFASWEGVRTVAIVDAAGAVLAPPERAGSSLTGGDLLARARKDRAPVSARTANGLEIVAPAVQNGEVVGFSWVTFDPRAGMPVVASPWVRAFGSLAVVMMVVAVLVIGGWLTLIRPISVLAEHAEALAHGEATLLAPSARARPIERLTHAVNRALLRVRRSEGGEA